MAVPLENCVLIVVDCSKSGHDHGPGGPSVNPDSQAGSEQQRHEVGEEETGVGEASPTASLRGRLDGAGQGQRPVFGGGGTRYGRA